MVREWMSSKPRPAVTQGTGLKKALQSVSEPPTVTTSKKVSKNSKNCGGNISALPALAFK